VDDAKGLFSCKMMRFEGKYPLLTDPLIKIQGVSAGISLLAIIKKQ
jgi:hypothetical protein